LIGIGGCVNSALPPRSFLHLIPSVLRVLIAVVGGHAVLAKTFLQSFDFLPGQAQPRADDQVLIADGALVVQREQTLPGIDSGYRRLHPVDLARHNRGHRPDGVFDVVGTTADQRPRRLVIVLRTRLDHGDFQVRIALEQARDKTDAGSAAADDHDVCTDGWAPVLIVHCLFLLLHARIVLTNT
jgi:hypothetical protein